MKKQIVTSTKWSWYAMNGRCNNKNNHQHKDYGGRGIKICKRWKNFNNFLNDMGKRPKGTTLDRIDNDGNYCPKNCRWATRKEQNRNKRKHIIVNYHDKEITLAEYAEIVKMNFETLRSRYYRGKSLKEVIKPSLCRPAKL